MSAKKSSEKPSKLPKVVNTLMVATLGVTVAIISLQLLPQGTAAVTTDPQNAGGVGLTGNSAPAAQSPTLLARTIAATHLFGDASQKPAVVEQEAEPVEVIEDTRLNLQLAGVFAFEPAENAIAIISSGSAEQNAYGVGDKIDSNTSLEEVHSDHVILRNRGKLEKLGLPDNVEPIALARVEEAPAATSSDAAQGGGQSLELPTNPRELRDTLARNPSILGQVVAAEPYQENGKLLGFRITPKQNPEILEAQGIVAGDVITRVNDIQLNSQKQGIRALRNAVKAENLDVTILRDGIEVPISISLAQ